MKSLSGDMALISEKEELLCFARMKEQNVMKKHSQGHYENLLGAFKG